MRQQWADFGTMQASSLFFFTYCFIEALATRPRPKGKPKPDLVTDMFYWLISPTIRVLSRIGVVLLLLWPAALIGIEIGPTFLHGYGPISRQPRWLLAIELLVLMDFSTYWSHRAFHHF